MEGLLAIAGPAQDDKAINDEPFHERACSSQASWSPDLMRGIPARAMDQPYREIGNGPERTGRYRHRPEVHAS